MRAIAALIALACVRVAFAGEPLIVHQGIAHDALYDVCFDARGGVAVGAAGVILESDVNGTNWTPAAARPTALALLGVACGEGRRIAVGQLGQLFLDDGGGWRAVATGTEQRLLAVAINGSGLAVAVGGFGTVLVSHDAAETWAAPVFDWPAIVEDFADPHLYDVDVSDAGVITLVGEFGIVMRSEDAGKTWQRAYKGDASLFGLHIDPSGEGYAVGQQGCALRTVDGGASWEQLASPVDALLLDVWSAPGAGVLISGMRSMLHSDNEGQNWSAMEGADIAVGWYAALAPATGSKRIFSVGNEGRVLELPFFAANQGLQHNQ